MVVSAATNCSDENDQVREWLAGHRRARTATIVKLLKRSVRNGELRKNTDAQALGDLCASVLHGVSVQARDGVSRERLLSVIPPLIAILKANQRCGEDTC
jgi:hypothetical protein